VSIPDVPLGPITPRCAAHPDEPAGGTCARCGTFFCGQCVQWISGQAWCAPCAARPEINYLEQFRLKLWGRRDGWAWLVGLGSLILAAIALQLLVKGAPPPLVALLAALAGVGVAFFLGVRWAREALVGAPLLLALLSGLLLSPGAAVLMALLSLCALSVYFDTRNQLFFRREVSPQRLQQLWHLRENNPLARNALNFGVGALFVPVFAPLAILLGVLALRRVDPHAVPPIGRKGQAIAALVLGTGVVGVWAVVLWPLLRKGLAALLGS
jgi:hypothetical protein